MATNLNFVPMSTALTETLLAQLKTVTCNGEQAYTTAYLVGFGSSLSLFPAWSVAWQSQQTLMKYYAATSQASKQALRQYEVDFGIVSDGLTPDWYSAMPDVGLLPIIAYAFVPGMSPTFWKH